MLGDAVSRGAEQMVAQEMSAVAEHDQVSAELAGDLHDQLGRVAGAQLDLELDAGLGGLLAGTVDEVG